VVAIRKKCGVVVLSALFLAAFLLGSCSARKPAEPAAPAEPVDPGKEIVAQVNGVNIYAADLNLGVTRYQQKLASAGQEPDTEKEGEYRAAAAALQTLIENELLFQEAQRRGFTAVKERVDEELAAIAGQFPTQPMFEKALAQMNLTPEDLRRDLEHAQSVKRMIETSIEPGVTVSAEEVRAYYDANPRLFTDPERIRARHIFLRIVPDTTEDQKAEMRRILEQLRQRALRGESFAELARQYSQDKVAKEDGDLGFIARGQVAKDFETTLFALQPGEISGVVTSVYGYHLIQAVEHQPAALVSFARVEKSLTEFVRKRKVDEAVTRLTQELRDKAKISIPQKSK
jgi:peptidyl-prolyl cis-trans isomerase C